MFFFFLLCFSLSAYPIQAQEFPPRLLSDMGIFDPIEKQHPSANLVPYTVNSPFWSDGTIKNRFILLPSSGKVGFSSNGNFEFPSETVLIKNFYLIGLFLAKICMVHSQCTYIYLIGLR